MGQVIQFRPRRAAARPMYEDVVLAARLASVTTAVWIVLSPERNGPSSGELEAGRARATATSPLGFVA